MKYINSKDIKVYFDGSSFDFSAGKVSKIFSNSNKSKLYQETLSRDFTIKLFIYMI